MKAHWRQWWPVAKAVLALAIVGGVGWRFATILRRPELWERPLSFRYEWLAGSALLYVLGLALWCAFWYRLIVVLGQPRVPLAVVRAYFVGHLGKYVPGKAWSLLVRTGMLAEAGIRPAVAALTATYETLTTMAAGALVAAVLFALLALESSHTGWAFTLLALAGLPVLPPVFNPLMRIVAGLAQKAARKFGSDAEIAPLPRVRVTTLLSGLALTAAGWALLGLSLWAVVQALAPAPPAWSWESWGRYTAASALAYVAGFVVVVVPAGLGVRETFLVEALVPELLPLVGPEQAEWLAMVIVLVLRLLWTAAEVIMAGISSLVIRPSSLAKADGVGPMTNDQ